MNILVTGSSGFIGSAIVDVLRQRGHVIVTCSHHRGKDPAALRVDYMQDTAESAWRSRLHGIDVVINAVGILRESAHARFAELHHRAPAALFQACQSAGVKRVIQISALGSDETARSAYHLSKKAADDVLRASDLDWVIVQPSLVFGAGSASTKLFLRLASLPVIPLIGRGEHLMQPIHIDDLSMLIAHLVETPQSLRQTLFAVGPEPVTLRDLLLAYRKQLRLKATLTLPIPLSLIRLAAKMGDALKSGALSTETLDMLLRGNTADVAGTRLALKRCPRKLDSFIPAAQADAWRTQTILQWLSPLLIIGIASMWISAGVLSWLFAQTQGLALLAALGLPIQLSVIAFAAACLLDVLLGLATLRPNRGVWAAQLVVIAFYSAALTVAAPQLWADPFGPLVKNLPLAGLILGLMALEKES